MSRKLKGSLQHVSRPHLSFSALYARNEMKQIKLERNETKGNVGGHFETFCSEQDLYVGRTQKNLKHFCLRNNTPFGLVEISSGVIYINNSLVLKLSVVSSVHGLLKERPESSAYEI